MSERPAISTVLRDCRVLLTVGTGGVGKTTMAAAIGLAAALQGRRVMVLTIDPARALARALGSRELRSESHAVDLSAVNARRPAGGCLHAAMLDQKGAWDAFIRRHAPSEETCQALLNNRFYQHLSTSLAGSTEYMALEELCQLHDSGQYDLIVIDTPPASHAVDFLKAPQRIDHLFDPEVVRWLGPRGQWMDRGVRIMSRGLRFAVRQLQRAAGVRTLREISAFFAALEALLGDMQRRSRRAQALLRSEETAFVLIAGPSERVLAEGDSLLGALHELGVKLRAVVINRVHPLPQDASHLDAGELRALLAQLGAEGVHADSRDWLRETWDRACLTQRVERGRLAQFAASMPDQVAWAEVAELPRDTHSLMDLRELASRLGIGPAMEDRGGTHETEEGAIS